MRMQLAYDLAQARAKANQIQVKRYNVIKWLPKKTMNPLGLALAGARTVYLAEARPLF